MRKRRRGAWRMLALMLALWLAFPCHAVADTIEEVQAKQEALQKENEELEQRIDALRADEAKALEYQAALEEKIDLTERKIDAARESIQTLDREIAALEKKLEASRKESEETIQTFSQRIRALYVSGGISTLEILLSSTSFKEFSLKTEMLSAVSRHDRELLDKIEDYLEKTQEDREKVQRMREEAARAKEELESAQKELVALHEENNALIAELEEQQAMVRETIAANEAEDAELETELQRLIEERNEEERRRQEAAAAAQAGNEEGYVVPGPLAPGMHEGFGPCWPLPGVGIDHLSGRYGEMYFNGPHNGTDIWAYYGTPIVAAQAGQVLSAEYHWSWGNNVLIWHNSEYSTRYAHMSSIAVSAGQYVEQGEIIGYVGSTGESFGDHLHFEVYYHGVRVAPEPYLGI